MLKRRTVNKYIIQNESEASMNLKLSFFRYQKSYNQNLNRPPFGHPPIVRLAFGTSGCWKLHSACLSSVKSSIILYKNQWIWLKIKQIHHPIALWNKILSQIFKNKNKGINTNKSDAYKWKFKLVQEKAVDVLE